MALVSVYCAFSTRSKNCSAAKCSELEFACGCNGLESRSGQALSAGFVLVDTTLTPPGFVTSQLVVTCGYHGFKSRRIWLWWTRIHLQPALWIANQLSTFCWVFNAVVIIWFVTFYTQPLTQQQQQKTFLLKYWAWLIFDSEECWVYSNVDWIRFCPRRQIVWLTWALNQKFRRSWNIFRWAT